MRYGNDDEQLFVWGGEGREPRLVYTGPLRSPSLYWSPDGMRLMFNGAVNDQDTIYAMTATGDVATVFLTGYRVHGWVNGGNHLLVSHVNQDSALYLVQADGSSPMYFSQRAEAIAVSPDGEQVLYGDFYYDSSFVQATDSLTASPVPHCRGRTYQWRKDSDQFACDSNNIGSGIGTQLGNVSTVPPQLQFLSYYTNPTFIPNSTRYLALNRVRGYPAYYDSSFLYNFNSGVFKQIQYAEDDTYPVIEWRYMP